MRYVEKINQIYVVAAVVAAIILSSCREEESDAIDFSQVPVQTVDSLSIVSTTSGNTVMRMTAPLMQRFDYMQDTLPQLYEYYPQGIHVDAYSETGELETTITALEAKHITLIGAEAWSAFGDVVVLNHIKGEKVESDTIYWNRDEHKLYTDCYVRLTSVTSGMMQGYGMETDERARHTVILHPFDSYTVVHDSTFVYTDTVNIVGPVHR